ncbi:hypothetical protein C1141_09810 [Vibrio agarivorans]|nr:hypothetical protein C1141_09810 [Vibrio agarivorans]
MSQQRNFHPPILTQDVETLFKQLDSYDDPCLLFLYANNLEQWRYQILLNTLQDEKISTSEIYQLSVDVSFCLCFDDATSIQVLADELINKAKESGTSVFLSVFRHNCLAKPKDTFDWGVVQLKKLVETSTSDMDLAINDFTDRTNWPGLEEYTRPKETNPLTEQFIKEEPKLGWLIRIAKRFGFASKKINLAELEQLSSLSMVRPFIESLPNGEALWHYVLTGHGKDILDEQNAFIDLDGVLLLVHANRFAPEFYRHILDVLRYDSIPEQNDIHDDFERVIYELAEELLEAETGRATKQTCMLRLLDIFYHIFDQTTWSDNIYEILVETEGSSCLTDAEFKARYSRPTTEDTDNVTAETQQAILELLDDFEDYHFCSYKQWRSIEKIFVDKRLAVNPNCWKGSEPSSHLLLASILLYKDKQTNINDSNTQALRQLIDDLLLPEILRLIESDLEHDETLPNAFVTWLHSDSTDIDFDSIQQLKSVLAGDIGMDAHRTKHQAQPHTQLFSSISDFMPILASCYWLQLSEPRLLTQKVITMALRLAPQATLSCFTRLQMPFSGRFKNDKQKKQLLVDLSKIEIDAYDFLTFEVRLAQSHDIPRYRKLVRKYAKLKKDKQQLWDIALAKVTPRIRDYFYLDVYRLAPKVATPLLTQRSDMLDELINKTSHFDDDFIKTMFTHDELSFSERREFLPEKYKLPIVIESEVERIKQVSRFALFILADQKLKLIAVSGEEKLDSEAKLLDFAKYSANFYVIINDSVERNTITTKLHSFISYTEREKRLKQGIQDFLSGKLTFEHYQNKFDHYSDSKVYDIYIENYCEYSTCILPQILAEPDEQVQLRLIKLLCSHRTRGKRILRKIAENMFFDHYLTNGRADFEMRHDPELDVDDLTDDWIERWQNFHKELEHKINAVQ